MKAKSKIEPGRPEFMIGAHCLNHNAHSIGICYEGGLDSRGQPADKLKGWCPWVLLVIVLQRTAVIEIIAK